MQNTYPPGSVFKIVTAIAALEQGAVHPSDAVSCSGATRVFNHTFRCWKRGGHGRVDLRRAIAQSCDVYFYHLGARLTIDPIASWSKRLGLGATTGLDLVGRRRGSFRIASGACASAAPCGFRARPSRCRSVKARCW
jgi:penicillin-binding protein 2